MNATVSSVTATATLIVHVVNTTFASTAVNHTINIYDTTAIGSSIYTFDNTTTYEIIAGDCVSYNTGFFISCFSYTQS